jgi:hypothetical protein
MGIENIGHYDALGGIGYTQQRKTVQGPREESFSPGPASEMSFSPAARIASQFNLRNITPKEVSHLAEQMLQQGMVSFDNYNYLSFQPELSGNHASLIESFTGEAVPEDQPFDLLASLEDTLSAQQQTGASPAAIDRTQSLLDLMTNLDYMSNLGL